MRRLFLMTFISVCFFIISKTLLQDAAMVYDSTTGLYRGESTLNFGEENVNMNKDDINRAMLDQLRVIRLSAAE